MNMSGPPGSGKTLLARALETAERVGNPSQVAFMLTNLGQILLSLGAWEEASEHLERAEEVLAALP